MDAIPHTDDDLTGDLLVGADAIRDYLASLGMDVNPYYLRKSSWPIGKTGGRGGYLIASRRRLARHAMKLATATTWTTEEAPALGDDAGVSNFATVGERPIDDGGFVNEVNVTR
jgi:hypothetical protein